MNSFDETMTPRDRVDGIDSILRELMGTELEENPLPTPPSCRDDRKIAQQNSGHCNMRMSLCPDGEYASLAMVYSPYQKFDDLYDTCEEALAHGTLFRSLYMPMENMSNSGMKGGCRK